MFGNKVAEREIVNQENDVVSRRLFGATEQFHNALVGEDYLFVSVDCENSLVNVFENGVEFVAFFRFLANVLVNARIEFVYLV